MTYEPNQTVYLSDGREAVYVMANGDQHLVRVVREVEDEETGPYSYPDDKITPAYAVYKTPPVEVYDAAIADLKAKINDLNAEITAKRAEAASILRNKVAMEREAAKYPSIQQALDFIEGRITHVVHWTHYQAATIAPVKDAPVISQDRHALPVLAYAFDKRGVFVLAHHWEYICCWVVLHV